MHHYLFLAVKNVFLTSISGRFRPVWPDLKIRPIRQYSVFGRINTICHIKIIDDFRRIYIDGTVPNKYPGNNKQFWIYFLFLERITFPVVELL